MRKQQGLSLVELMISITLGLVLMTGVMQMFLSSRSVFTTHQAISRIQESGRLGMEFISRDIRMAGYMGCMSRNMENTNDPYAGLTNTLNDSANARYDFGVGIEGATATASGAPPSRFSDLPDDLAPNSDILVVRSANGNAVGVHQITGSDHLSVDYTGEVAGACSGSAASTSGLCAEDILVIADCTKARVFQATYLSTIGTTRVNVGFDGAGVTPGNEDDSWEAGLFDTDAEVIQVARTVYFVAANADGGRSLWQKIGDQAAQELLEGVVDMRLSYGLDTDGDNVPDDYVAASEVSTAEWEQVGSVRVQLLLESLADNVLEEPQPYIFPYTFDDDDATTPTDRRMRQVFVNTIGIRSRLP